MQTGSINIADTTEFNGAEVLLRGNWFRECGGNLDFLLGYRYLRLSDNLQMNESETSIDPEGAVPVGTQLALSDSFHTLNEFNGVDLGMAAQWHCCRWSHDLLMKMGLGQHHIARLDQRSNEHHRAGSGNGELYGRTARATDQYRQLLAQRVYDGARSFWEPRSVTK